MAHWFKFYGSDYLTDPKMMALSPTEKAYWVTLLCLASNTNDGVVKHLTEERLKMLTGVSPSDTEWASQKSIFDTFKELELIRFVDCGIEVVNFLKRQESYLTEAERSARYRAKNKLRDESHEDSVTKITVEQNRIEQSRIDKTYLLEKFNLFWSAYPRKESKKKAEQSWLKLKLTEELFTEIMAGLEKSKKSSQWTKDSGQFIPHPTTWLNQERWKDEGVKQSFSTGGSANKFAGIGKKI